MKPRVLHVHLERAQRCVLYLRRKRMCHWIAENTQANRWIDVARDLRPFLQIGECVAIGKLLFFFHATASFSLTPCFSWVLQANYVNSTGQRFAAATERNR